MRGNRPLPGERDTMQPPEVFSAAKGQSQRTAVMGFSSAKRQHVALRIDRVLASQHCTVAGQGLQVWSPRQSEDAALRRSALRGGTDHFPMTLDIA